MKYQLKTIVAAIDFSNASLHALEVAVQLAKQHHAALHLLYVVETELGAEDPSRAACSPLPVTKALKDAILHQFGITPQLIELCGIPYVHIVSYAERLSADLLVVGSHGWSGRRDGYLGTTAYSVVKHCTCPVFLVPSGSRKPPFKKVVFALRPLSGTMRLFHVVRQFIEHDARVDILSRPYHFPQIAHGQDQLLREASLSLSTVSYHWNDVPSMEQSRNGCLRDGAIYSQDELLVLTPSIGAVSRIGYVAPEAQAIINKATVAVLYLVNFALYKAARQA